MALNLAGILQKLPSLPSFKLLDKLKEKTAAVWRNFRKTTPIDARIFLIAFFVAFPFLLVSSFFIPKYVALLIYAKKTQGVAGSDEVRSTVMSQAQIDEAARKAASEPRTDRQLQAIATNDAHVHDALIAAPVAQLEEEIEGKAVPHIAEDGRKPWFIYSRPFDRIDPRPRIAVVVGELGLGRVLSEAAISDLPGPITLAFSGYSTAPEAWMARSRGLGHETLLTVPMEPLEYPVSDPGPGTLLVKNGAEQNNQILLAHLQKGKGYVGLTTFSGSRLSNAPDRMRPLLDSIKSRGLLWFDAQLTPLSSGYALARETDMPAVRADFRVEDDAALETIALAFKDAETSARQTGRSVLLVHVSPLTLRMLKDWAATLSGKDIALAPVSAMAE